MSDETSTPFAEATAYGVIPLERGWSRGSKTCELQRVTVKLYRRLPSIVLGSSMQGETADLPTEVRALLLASGYEVPRCRIVCDTAPRSNALEAAVWAVLALPLAMAILRASGQVKPSVDLEHTIYFGQWSPGGLTWARPTYPLGISRDRHLALVADVAVEHSMSMVVPENCLEAMAPVAGSFLKGATTLRQVAEQECTFVLPGFAGEERKA